MRKILYICLASFCLSLTAHAQTPPPKDAPAKEAPKTDKKEEEKSIDLDAFFKKGEENAETSSCNKPATPADPVA